MSRTVYAASAAEAIEVILEDTPDTQINRAVLKSRMADMRAGLPVWQSATFSLVVSYSDFSSLEVIWPDYGTRFRVAKEPWQDFGDMHQERRP